MLSKELPWSACTKPSSTPVSCWGKKVLGMAVYKYPFSTTTASSDNKATGWWRSTQARLRRYARDAPWPRASSQAPTSARQRSARRRARPAGGKPARWGGTPAGRSSTAAIIGVVVRDTSMEIRMAADSTTANSRNKRPTTPPISRMGMNTAIRETLMDTTVKPISRAPCKAAARAGMPRSVWRVMFSSTTMASSTTKPVATVSAIAERLSRL